MFADKKTVKSTKMLLKFIQKKGMLPCLQEMIKKTLRRPTKCLLS